MNITQVLYALAVVRYRNFSKAAESLFISQPALSIQIRKLEDELGFPLFLRTPQGVQLTTYGEKFYHDAESVEKAWSLLLDNCSSQKAIQKHVRMGVSTRVYSNGLFDALVQFFDKHPEVEVTFSTGNTQYFSDLEAGRLDLAVVRQPEENILESPEKFYFYNLIPERQCVLTPFDHPLTSLNEVSYTQLQGYTIISGTEKSTADANIQQVFQKYNVTPARIYRSDSVETVISLVESGKGITLGPSSFGSYFGIRAIPLVPATYVYMQFICLREREKDPAILMLKQFLVDLCNNGNKT